jgi:hypothetical protein
MLGQQWDVTARSLNAIAQHNGSGGEEGLICANQRLSKFRTGKLSAAQLGASSRLIGTPGPRSFPIRVHP